MGVEEVLGLFGGELLDVLELAADGAGSDGGIVFANPNAPTGRPLNPAEIERLLDYLRGKDEKRYKTLIETLGIRK